MIRFKTAAAALALALATAAAAAPALTAYEKAELAQLSPEVRKQVEARMTGQQTVRGILETMLLNSISEKVAYNQVVAIDFDKSIIVVTNPKGAVRAYEFDATTLVVNPNSTPKPSAPAAMKKK